MNKKISYLQILMLLASSCYVCQGFAMDRAATEAGDRAKVAALEKRYHLALDLAEPENALPVLCELAKANGEKTLWRTWAHEDITQAISELREIQARCGDGKDAVFTATVSNLLLNLEILKYVVAQQVGFETEGIVVGAMADEGAALARMSEARDKVSKGHEELIRAEHDQMSKTIAALTGIVDTQDKFEAGLAALTSKVDGLSGSVSSRFAESETREKTELARMTAAHERVATALAALTGRVDAHDSLASALAGLTSRVDELNKSIPDRLSAVESRLREVVGPAFNGSLDTLYSHVGVLEEGFIAHSSRLSAVEGSSSKVSGLDARLGAVEGLLSRVSRIESWFDPTDLRMGGKNNVPVRFSALEARLGAIETRMGTFASQTDLDATRVSLNGVETRRMAMESRLNTTDVRLATADTKSLPGAFSRLSVLESSMGGVLPYCSEVIALKGRMSVVEGRSSSASGLEARLKALEISIAPLMEIYTRSVKVPSCKRPECGPARFWFDWR